MVFNYQFYRFAPNDKKPRGTIQAKAKIQAMSSFFLSPQNSYYDGIEDDNWSINRDSPEKSVQPPSQPPPPTIKVIICHVNNCFLEKHSDGCTKQDYYAKNDTWAKLQGWGAKKAQNIKGRPHESDNKAEAECNRHYVKLNKFLILIF